MKEYSIVTELRCHPPSESLLKVTPLKKPRENKASKSIKENTIITTNKFGALVSNQIEEIPKEGEKREVDESFNQKVTQLSFTTSKSLK
ncbi:hypothetical protein H5410_047241 [Solanum commersonii]|uniref:Uncharacterized protein n=1 Tax=Solanum commersonii TaxID=4109 RepID=A0A9J5XGP2_SOLCO|nr:hypothetical protein H5410_047241 [Solanum commersonii]